MSVDDANSDNDEHGEVADAEEPLGPRQGEGEGEEEKAADRNVADLEDEEMNVLSFDESDLFSDDSWRRR